MMNFRRRTLAPSLLLAAALLFVAESSAGAAVAAPAVAKPTTLTFVAGGTASRATIIYGPITKPIKKTVTRPHTATLDVDGDLAVIMRVNNLGSSGTVSCRIGGVLIAGRTEKVAKAWAQCNLQRVGGQGLYTTFGGDAVKPTTTKC